MIVYLLMILSYDGSNYLSSMHSIEFKDKIQCENAGNVLLRKTKIYDPHLTIYCQEVRK